MENAINLLNKFYPLTPGKEERKRRAAVRDAIERGFQSVVRQLTNWQRNQWARAGYPGLRGKEAALVQPFVGRVKA